MTEKRTPLLSAPATWTTTFPLVAPLGTGTTMLVELQVRGVAVVPLNLTLLPPWVEPKFTPVIVTSVSMSPDVGDNWVIEEPEDPELAVPGRPIVKNVDGLLWLWYSVAIQ